MKRITEDDLCNIAEPRFNGRLNLNFVDDEFAFMARAVSTAYDLIVELRKRGVNKIERKSEYEEFDYYVGRLFELCTSAATLRGSDARQAMKTWQEAFDFVANLEDMFN